METEINDAIKVLVEKAKTALKSAAIGYALAILAPVIVTVLKSLVGG